MNRRHHRLTGLNPLARRAQRRAREELTRRERSHRNADDDPAPNVIPPQMYLVNDNNLVDDNRNHNNQRSNRSVRHAHNVNIHVQHNDNGNANEDGNHVDEREFEEFLDDVLSPPPTASNAGAGGSNVSNSFFNSLVLQLFSRWSKSRKIEHSSQAAPSRPFVFKPGARSQIHLHDERSLAPMPRSGHRIVVDADYIYCFGGFNSAIECSNVQPELFRRTQPLFQELWRFSKLTRTWQHLPCTGDVPRTLVSASLIKLTHNHLLAFGGSGYPFGEHNSNEIHICDLKTFVWTKVVPNNDPDDDDSDDARLRDDDNEDEDGRIYPEVSREPQAGYGQGVVLDRQNSMLYVCGGTDGRNYNCDVHQFDLRKRKWKPLYGTRSPDMGRYRHELALYNDSLYLIGGGTSFIDNPNDVLDRFDLKTLKWSRVKTLPDPSYVSKYPAGRISHAFVQSGSTIYMIGGRCAANDFNDVWSLNLATMRWKCHRSMTLPRPTSFLSADVTVDGQLSIFGGVYNSLAPDRATRVNSVHQIWIKIPSLKRLASLALCDALSQNEAYEKSKEPIELLKRQFKALDLDHIVTLPKH